jgi:hypothetical protein
MQNVVVFLAVVAVGAAACATAPVTSSTALAPGAPCTSLAKQAAHRVQSVISSYGMCSRDEDCVTVPQGASCFDHCTTSMARAGEAALRAIVADVDAGECREFTSEGCTVEVPPCGPPWRAACRNGVCN